MNNLKKIMLGFLCLGFSSAYAFTPTQSNCETYINSLAPLNTNFFANNQSNIQACLEACPSLYGSSSDAATFSKIARCKKNLNTLSYIGENYLQNPQYANNNSVAPMMAPAPMQTAPAPAPSVPVAAAPAPAAPAQNEPGKPDQIKWF